MLRNQNDSQLNSKSDKTIVEHYISIVAHRVQVLRKKIEDAGQSTYSSASAATLSEVLVRILSRFFDELKSLHQEIDDQPPEDIIRQLQTIHYITSAIVPELVEAIRMANLDTTVASIIEAYEHIGNLVQYGTQTIIHPTWDYNASFDEIMTNLRAMARSLGRDSSEAIFSGAPRSFVIITYPIAEQDMVLRQAFLAHEIGHFINLTQEWSKSLLDEQVFDEQDRNDIHEAVEGQQCESNKEKLYEDALTLAGEFAPYWLGEIIADFLAVCVLGPAYLLAFDEVSLSPRYSIPNRLHRSHPPVQLRKEIMGSLIQDLYLGPIRLGKDYKSLNQQEQDVFNCVCKWIKAITHTDPLAFRAIENAPNMPPEVVATIYSTLKKAVQRAISQLRVNHLEWIKLRNWFCASRDVIDALELQSLLSYDLTPTHLYSDPSRDPSFPAVMNSGWFRILHAKEYYQYFKHGSEESKPDEVRDRYIDLQNLVAKAVENLHFKREFERRKGQGSEQNMS
jgi:hypothetical protein